MNAQDTIYAPTDQGVKTMSIQNFKTLENYLLNSHSQVLIAFIEMQIALFKKKKDNMSTKDNVSTKNNDINWSLDEIESVLLESLPDVQELIHLIQKPLEKTHETRSLQGILKKLRTKSHGIHDPEILHTYLDKRIKNGDPMDT